jgi:uncharacterized protein YoxC
MTEHQKQKISKFGDKIFGLKANTFLTLLSIVLCMGTIFNWVVSPVRYIVSKVSTVDSIAKDVNEIKSNGSVPLQDMMHKLNEVCKDVNELQNKGALPLRERINKLEDTIEFIKPSLTRIEKGIEENARRLERHIDKDTYSDVSKSLSPNDTTAVKN